MAEKFRGRLFFIDISLHGPQPVRGHSFSGRNTTPFACPAGGMPVVPRLKEGEAAHHANPLIFGGLRQLIFY
jgi:hypothetical protein